MDRILCKEQIDLIVDFTSY